MKENQALIIQVNKTKELVLAPVKPLQGHAGKPMYLGWLLAAGIPKLVCNLLSSSQLVLILDLNHTLVESHSIESLERRKEECGRERQELCKKIHEGSQCDREKLQLFITSSLKEEELLEGDIKLLREFSLGACDNVHVDGVKYLARPETAYTDKGSKVQRPVIHLPDGSIITRIDPQDPKTSTLVRVRPGWNDLRAYLLEKNRFDIYVCTHANREYALEVWRLLDINGAIIPHEQRQSRIISVPRGQNKTLLGVLSGRKSSEVTSLHSEGSIAAGQFPLAVVVDDNKDAWEEASQPHILQVTPWLYHLNEAAYITQGNTTVAESDKELARTSRAVKSLRGDVYECIDKWVRPEMDRIAEWCAPLQMLETDVASLLPRLLSVPDLLQGQGAARAEGPGRRFPEEVAAAGAPAAQVTPVGLAAASLPRDLRHGSDPQMAPSTAATAGTAQQAGPSTAAMVQDTSTAQVPAMQLNLDGVALGHADKDMQAAIVQLQHANLPFLQVVHMIMQVMLARPDCRHMAEYVIGACEKRSTFLPRAMECLRCHGDWGLPLLFGELQAEEHSATKAAALAAAAEAAATQLASSQAEVQKLKEERAAQAEALKAAAAQELAAAKAVINSLMAEAALSSQALAALEAATARLKQERDDVLKHAQKRFEEQVSQLKAGASSASAQVLAAEQRGAQLERELAHVKAEQAKERSAAKREVEQLQAQLAVRQDTASKVAKDLMESVQKLQEGGGGSRSAKARSWEGGRRGCGKRHRDADEASGAELEEAVTMSVAEDEGDRGTRPRSGQQSSRKTPSSISPTYA